MTKLGFFLMGVIIGVLLVVVISLLSRPRMDVPEVDLDDFEVNFDDVAEVTEE